MCSSWPKARSPGTRAPSSVAPHLGGTSGGAEHAVTEETDWKLSIPVFWVLFWLPFWLHVRRGMHVASPWWAPGGRLDTRAATVIGYLGILAIVNGYIGTVIGQTLTFAADEFCGEFETAADGLRTCVDPAHDKSARANVFTIARIAVVLSLALTIAADRYGRKKAMAIAVTVSCAATALGAFAPSLGFVAATQIVARGLATGVSILIAVFAAEELPARSRAYGVSMLVLLAGLGSGMVVWVLPAADIAEWGWRIVYGLGILFFLSQRGRRANYRPLDVSQRWLEPRRRHHSDSFVPLPYFDAGCCSWELGRCWLQSFRPLRHNSTTSSFATNLDSPPAGSVSSPSSRVLRSASVSWLAACSPTAWAVDRSGRSGRRSAPR